MTLLPTLEVRMMSVFLKSTVRPLESAVVVVAGGVHEGLPVKSAA